MNNLFFISLIIFSSFVLTELIRLYTLKKNIIDIPNERSSHSVPTSRGGGLSIIIVFFITASFFIPLSNDTLYGLVGAGALITIIGIWDDHNHVPAKWRLLVHFCAAAWVLFWLGGLPTFQLFETIINLSWVGLVIVAFALVWLLNLFNFMDGIDGIAASETIFVSTAGSYLAWLSGLDELSFICIVLAASTVGFLILNWPPAKIFMGDVGSGFLGLTLGIIVYMGILKGMSLWPWLILLAIFLVDSGVTLLRRVIKGDKWYEAHCCHAYQHAARKWGHKKVTMSVIVINVILLLPLAFLAHLKPELGFLLTLLTFMLLIVVAIKFKAGITYK